MSGRDHGADAAVPRGTVGKTIAVANTPASNSFALNSFAAAASPMITGVIGVSLCAVSNPAAFSSRFSRSPLAQSFLTRSSLC